MWVRRDCKGGGRRKPMLLNVAAGLHRKCFLTCFIYWWVV